MTDGSDPPPSVRALRESLGLTQQEMAERLAELAWRMRRARVGVNADMVSKWERSQKRPNALYTDLLRRLSASLMVEPLAGSHAVNSDAQRDKARVDALSLLQSLGPDAALLRGPVLDLHREELSAGDRSRRTPSPVAARRPLYPSDPPRRTRQLSR